MNHPCILIPVYNHGEAVSVIVERLHAYDLTILLVDDGSDSTCQHILEQLATDHDNIILKRLPNNQGKGGAVKAGLRHALEQGFSHALQIDADGQHDTRDLPRFLQASQQHPDAIVCGYPQYDDSVPRLRFYGRYLTHIWIWINSLSLAVKDTMCGYRVYPLAPVVKLINSESTGNRMEFDSEVMVRWLWRAGQVVNLPTRVHYPIDGISHFALWRDNALISKMHASLFFGMLWRAPRLLRQRLRSRQPRRPVKGAG